MPTMATINYNGMELEEVTKPQIFDPPKKCVVWNDDTSPNERNVLAVLPKESYRVMAEFVSNGVIQYQHCALLPDPPKPRRATNRELSRWLAQGNGECLGSQDDADTAWNYPQECSDTDVREGAKVRKWSDTEWHEPDVEYMGLEDK